MAINISLTADGRRSGTILGVNPLIAVGVLASTATTDAAYVFLKAAVTRQAPRLDGKLERW